MTDDGPLI
jgi:hypothetical protein